MSDYRESSTMDLIISMHILSRDIQSGDGVANAAIREAGDRLSKLHRMVNHAYPIIKAQHGADHMLDGFRPKKRAIDALLAEFESELVDSSAQSKEGPTP
jgi:hypothetical protein